MNLMMTFTHITLILAYTLISFLNDNFDYQFRSNAENRIATSFAFISGVVDIFLAFMMWFVLDDEVNTTFIRDESVQMTYPIIEVVKKQSDDIIDEVDTYTKRSNDSVDEYMSLGSNRMS